MSWLPISLTTLESHAVAPLLEACRMSAGELVTDRFPVVRDSIVQQIRIAIASGDYDLDEDETLIPPELVSCAAWLIIEQLVAVIPFGAVPLSEDQRTLLRSERARLDKIAKGDLRVTVPNDPASTATTQSGVSPVSSLGARTRRYSRDTLAGL
jgi:hypothetical protein